MTGWGVRSIACAGGVDDGVVGQIDATELPYQTAANLAVCPENDPDEVAAVAACFGFDLDQTIALEVPPQTDRQ